MAMFKCFTNPHPLGIHAREWIAPATTTFLMNELVANYGANKELADSFDWYFLPVFNVDGYEHTFTTVYTRVVWTITDRIYLLL
jgi:murein tripeptide amidase MpaA